MHYKKFLPFILLILSFNSAFSQDNNPVVCEVDTHKIYVSDFIDRYSSYLISTGINDNQMIRESIINNMISDILLYYYDDNSAVFSDPEYKKELQWVNNQVVLSYLKDSEVYAKIKVSDEELRKAFVRVNEKIAARHLFASTEKEANELYSMLKAGKSFEELAKSVFIDTVLKNNGGYLGYFTWGDMDPDFEEAAYSLKKGEISRPVKTPYGYSIIKLENRVPNPILTEDEFVRKKSQLERTLKISKKKPYEKEFVSSLFDFKKITFNNKFIEDYFKSENFSVNTAENNRLNDNYGFAATYDGKEYSAGYIKNKIENTPLYKREKILTPNSLKAAIGGYILQDILLKKAKSFGFDTLPLVKEVIRRQENAVYTNYKKNDILNNTVLPDSVAEAYYEFNKHLYVSPDQINIQEIIVADLKTAQKVKQLLIKGNDFGKLAQKYSLSTDSRKNNGVLGYADKDFFGILKDAFWNLEVSSVTDPIKVDNKYGIFKVLGKKYGSQIPYSEIKDDVIKAAKLERQNQIVLEYISKLFPKVKITIHRDVLSTVNVLGN